MTSPIVAAAGSAQDRAVPTLDRRALADFGRDDNGALPEFVVALIGQFLVEAGAQVEELRSAGQRGDAPALKAIAHALRGSSNMLGARRLGTLCQEIERAAVQPGCPGSGAVLVELDQEFVNVRFALRAELQGAGER